MVSTYLFFCLRYLLIALLGIEALDKIGVLHRDISIYNIVLAAAGQSGNRKGYIIDFDTAIRMDLPEQRIAARGKRVVSVQSLLEEVGY